MTKPPVQQRIGQAILDHLNDEQVAAIAKELIAGAAGGDHEAIKALCAFAEIAQATERKRVEAEAPPQSCQHPPEERETLETFGSGPRREKCSCGTMLINGKPLAGAKVEG